MMELPEVIRCVASLVQGRDGIVSVDVSLEDGKPAVLIRGPGAVDLLKEMGGVQQVGATIFTNGHAEPVVSWRVLWGREIRLSTIEPPRDL
jgi:hypothetical protein